MADRLELERFFERDPAVLPLYGAAESLLLERYPAAEADMQKT